MANSGFNKKIKSSKGFSLIEMLGAITILGILSIIAIAGVQMILDKTEDQFYKEQENNMILATQTFFQNNRNELPKKIGGKKKITLRDLETARYIDIIKDRHKNPCDKDSSYVETFKYSQSDYKYTVKLVCPGEYETLIDETAEEPTVTITLPTGEKTKNIKNLEAVVELKGNNDDSSIKLISYNYIIINKIPDSTSYKEVKNTGSIKVRATEKTLKIPLDKYVPGEIRIQVTAINEKGGVKTVTEGENYNDLKSPLCGPITGAGTAWQDIPERRITIQCKDDTDGAGCARPYYTKIFKNEAESEFIVIKDKAGNEYNCPVKVMIDRTKPTLKINVRNGSATGAIIKSYTADHDSPTQTVSTGWLNKTVAPNGLYFEYVVEDSVGVKKIDYKKNANGLKSNATNVNTYGSVQTINLEKTEADKENEIDTTKSSTGQIVTITPDGYNKLVATLTDLSGKTVTINLTAPLDKTEPTITYTNSSNGKWTKSNITVNGTATDAMSGISKTEYSHDKSTWKIDWTSTNTTTAPSKTWSTDINKKLYLKTTDAAGNSSVSTETAVKRDTVKPVITYTENKDPQSGGWYKTSDSSSLKVTIKCTDAASGADTFKVSGTEATNPVTKTIKNPHNPITYSSSCVDKAGNTESGSGSYKVKINSRISSCGCETAKTCSAAGCATYGTKTCYNYSFSGWTQKTGSKGQAYPGNGVSNCNSNNVGKFNRVQLADDCLSWGSNGRYCTDVRNVWKYRKCNKSSYSCTDYDNCTAYNASESKCGCKTYKSCWHY